MSLSLSLVSQSFEFIELDPLTDEPRTTKSERLDKRKLSVSAIEVFRQELSFNGGDKAEFGIGFVNSTWQPKNQSN